MYNPYINNNMPVNGQNFGFQQSYADARQVIKVNGENGARALNLAPNSSALVLDENNPIVWLCQTDGAGYKTVTPYEIKPFQPKPQVDVDALEQRIIRLEEQLNAKSNNRTTKQHKQPDESAEQLKIFDAE